MAQKVHVLLVDDMDGGEADETVTFAIDGVAFEIDLSTENADKLRAVLAPYAGAGRRTGGRQAKGRPVGKRTSVSPDTAAVRAWAKSHGYDVNDRGRIRADIREAYELAQAARASNPAATATSALEAPVPQPEPEPAPAAEITAEEKPAKKTAAKRPPAKDSSTPAPKRAAKKTAAAK